MFSHRTTSDAPMLIPDESMSRRQALTRLAGLGLVAAGSLVLLPEEAEVKPKQRNQRRRRRRKGTGTKARQQGSTLSAQAVRDQRSPELRPVTDLAINLVSHDTVEVIIRGTLTFQDIHLWYMKRGTRYSLTAELWDDDDAASYPGIDGGPLVNDDDYCNSFWTPGKGLQRLIWPTNRANPARTVSVVFYQHMHKSFLDRDPIGESEIFGFLESWRDSGNGWVRLGDTVTRNTIHRVF